MIVRLTVQMIILRNTIRTNSFIAFAYHIKSYIWYFNNKRVTFCGIKYTIGSLTIMLLHQHRKWNRLLYLPVHSAVVSCRNIITMLPYRLEFGSTRGIGDSRVISSAGNGIPVTRSVDRKKLFNSCVWERKFSNPVYGTW